MVIATRSFTSSRGEPIVAWRDQLVPDHAIVRERPSHFAPAPPFPPRRAGTSPSRSLTADEERQIISRRIAELDRDSRNGHRFERPETAARERFWAETERLLDSLRGAEPPTADVFQLDGFHSREAEAELAGIDALWEGGAPWQR
jgi:hypothetical protein